jgi:hypothetical protein
MERLERRSGGSNAGPAEAGRYRNKGEVSMLGITRWTPWTELLGLHRDLDSIVGRVFGEAVPRQTVDSFDSLTPLLT